jgi:hypothetical protein
MKRCQMCLDMARPEPIVAIDCRIAKALLQRNSVPSYTEVAQRICDLADKMRIAMTTQIRFTAETQRRMFNHSFRMQFDSPQRRRERGEEHASLLAPLRTLRLCGEYQTVKCDSPQRRRERGVGIRSSSQPTGSTNNPPAVAQPRQTDSAPAPSDRRGGEPAALIPHLPVLCSAPAPPGLLLDLGQGGSPG